MSEETQSIPRTFYVIGSLALVWNLFGFAAYIMQVLATEESMQGMDEYVRNFYLTMPAWATSAFAVAVTSGVAGSVLLLMRNSWCVPVFLVSLAAVLVQNYHAFVMGRLMLIMGPTSAILPILVFAIGVGLIWYARYAKEKGWFN